MREWLVVVMVTPGMKSIIGHIVETVPICKINHSNTKPPRSPQIRSTQTRGTYPGEGLQTDFTVMLRVSGNFRYLLVLVDTFSGWIEAFPARTEMAAEVAKRNNSQVWALTIPTK